MIKRRDTLALGVAAVALPSGAMASQAQGSAPMRVLRYAFPVAESGFDPAQISDSYSRTVTAHIFEALYGYDHLARPARIVPPLRRLRPRQAGRVQLQAARVLPLVRGQAHSPAPPGAGRRVPALH